MRTLGNDLWLFDIIYILFIIIVCSVNIFVYVKHRRNIVTAIFHVSSLFLLLSVICNMMDRVILQLSIELFYQKLSVLFFGLFIAGMLIVCIVVIYKRVKEKSYFNLPPNLELAYSSVEDLAIVIDYNGKIIKANHPGRDFILPKNTKTFTAILDNLDGCFSDPQSVREEVENAKDSIRYEILISEINMYYCLIISPIFVGEQKVGFLVLFLDITAIKQLETTLTEQNLKLEKANKELANYIKVAGALEAQTERLHITENILSLLTVKIERAKENIHKIRCSNTGSDEYRKSVKKISEELREIYKEVRASVSQISGKVN